ncbi:AsmA family protein [Parvibaculaceae bacterium PLY_AMNH_Bact1]|nr:AsmA family protein [Parvibaculaceae bacterium PLY_AMNH_Bact1]
MSRFLSFLFVLVLLVVGVLFAAPSFIPVESYKPQIAALVKEQTGRDLTIDGDISLSFLPRLAVSVNDVTFQNASWASSPHMAKMEQLEIVLKIFPLIRGEVALDRFIMRRPEIDLAVNRQGVGNWVFDVPAPSASTPAAETAPASDEGGFTPQVTDIQLGEISLIDGSVKYSNLANGETYDASEINLDVSLPSLDAPLELDGSVAWNGDTVELSLDVAEPRAFSVGEASDISLNINAPKVTASFTGNGKISPVLTINGTTSLNIPSVRRLAAWAGQPMADGDGFGALDLNGTVAVVGDKYSFTGATLAFDGMNGTGDLTVDAGRSRPKLSGALALDRLDANVYLAGGGTGGSSDGQAAPSGGSGGSGGGSAAASGWSDAPIDLSGLKAVDADLDLSVGEILFQDLTIGKSALDVLMSGGKLTAKLTELALYEGAGVGQLVLDGSGNTPSVGANFNLNGLSAYPFLKDAAGFERLEGLGSFNVNVTTRGKSQKAMMSALNGSGAVTFADGAIRGINIAQLSRNVFAAATSGWESGGAQSTDFSELGGTFTITNGVLTNNDLKMLSPLVRVTGKGTVSMPPQTLNYRVEPKLAATLEGQGGSGDVKGIEVPIVISGPWSNPSFTPDLAAIISNPEGIKDVIDSVKEDGGKGLLQGILGGGGASDNGSGGASDEEKPRVEDAIRGLFNR